jgi:thiol:disulfide interchange protein DsbD
MIRVRQAFGILIAVFAVYYIIVGIRLLDKGDNPRDGWHSSLEDTLAEAKHDSKPILIEFTGKSCKACDTMDRTTFKNKEVLETLKRFAKLEVNIDENSTENTALIDRFNIIGAPSFVFLKSSDKEK